jgi:DNA-binding NarL/FixJ family response regulator
VMAGTAPELRLLSSRKVAAGDRALAGRSSKHGYTFAHGMREPAIDSHVAVQPVTVLIADDHTLVREGMKLIVAGVVAQARFVEAHDADSLLQAAADPAVRIALLDLNMPGMHGGFRLIELARRQPKLPLIVVSSLTSTEIVRRVTNISTVHAFVPKSSDMRTMHQAIENAMLGKRWSPAVRSSLASRPTAMLTPRQLQICELLRQGMSNKMIAGALGISSGTVKNHITEIFRVLNTTNRTQAAQLGFDTKRG